MRAFIAGFRRDIEINRAVRSMSKRGLSRAQLAEIVEGPFSLEAIAALTLIFREAARERNKQLASLTFEFDPVDTRPI